MRSLIALRGTSAVTHGAKLKNVSVTDVEIRGVHYGTSVALCRWGQVNTFAVDLSSVSIDRASLPLQRGLGMTSWIPFR